MALLDDIKKADRITNNALDDDITRLIGWVRAEMVRVGVPSDKASSDSDPLINQCIVEGVLSKIASDKEVRDAASTAYIYQLDNLRKHNWEEEQDAT